MTLQILKWLYGNDYAIATNKLHIADNKWEKEMPNT